MSAREIVRIASENGWLVTSGRTPAQTMKSKLSTDILKRRDRSLFMRTAKAKFALRSWRDFGEYKADPYQKALLDEDIVVFHRDHLADFVPGPGLHRSTIDSARDLLRHCSTMRRVEAEADTSVVQLVSVFLVVCGDSYLTYKRTKRLPESRLHDFYSIIFGGHINPEDMAPLFNVFDPADGAIFLTRELGEELVLPKRHPPDLRYLGLLYDDSRPLSRQHLGICYRAHLQSPRFGIGERGFLADAKFETLPAILARLADFENWSAMIVNEELRNSGDRSGY